MLYGQRFAPESQSKTNEMRKLFLFLIIPLLFLSCSDDSFIRNDSDQNLLPESKVLLPVDLISGNFNKPTKANTSVTESKINNVWALCFENTNADTYDSNAVLSEIAQVDLTGVNKTVILSRSDKPAFILFIANAEEIINNQKEYLTGKTYQSIIENNLLYGSSSSAGLKALSNPESVLPFIDETTHSLITPLPMYGTSAIIPQIQKGVKINSVLLSRSVSKLTVDATKAATTNGFILTGISLINVFDKGLINPTGITGNTPVNTSTRINFAKTISGKLQPVLQTVNNQTTSADPFYFFRNQQAIEVIIRGSFNDNPENRFYKVYINEDVTLSNVSYILNIESVSNKGYATMEDAIAAPDGSGMVVNVLISDDSHEIIANKDHFLGVSNSEFMLFADGAQNDVTVATITTNAFSSNGVIPQTHIELINGVNMSLLPGQNISSNSTDIKVSFTDDQTAEGIIRITIGTLVKDINVKKDWAIAGNFGDGKSGIFIADNVIEAHCTQINGRLGFATSATSPDRNATIESDSGTSLYAFIKSITGKDIIEFRALTKTGQTVLVRNITDIPEFAGNNIYWDAKNKNLKFDNFETASRENTLNIIGLQGYGWGNMIMGRAASYPIATSRFTVVPNDDEAIATIHGIKENILPNQTYAETNNGYMRQDPNNNMGDICIFMSKRGLTPVNNYGNRKWRLPDLDNIKRLPKRVSFSPDWTQEPVAPNNAYGLSKTAFAEYAEMFYFPLTLNVQYGPFLENKLYQQNFKYPMNYRSDKYFQFFMILNGNMPPRASYYANSIIGYSIRCVADNSPEVMTNLYKVSYEWKKAIEVGDIFDPKEYSQLKSQFVEQGGSVTLSSIKLECRDKTHAGWILNGKIYPLGATVTNINQDMPLYPYIRDLIAADSNIYWDGANLTFDYNPENSSPITETQQGVMFKFGSLVGVGPDGTVLTDPGMSIPDIPALYIESTPGKGENENTIVLYHDPAKRVGDICKYLSENGLAPEGAWRVPTAEEYRLLVPNYNNISPWQRITNIQSDGQSLVSWGTLYVGKVLLPPSGVILEGNTIGSRMGYIGYYWTSTASMPSDPFLIRLGLHFPVYAKKEGFDYQTLMPIRCVK